MEPLNFFEKFLSIPRESGNEKQISEYLIDFAKNNNLEWYTDNLHNVIIKKPSNNNSNETIILQGHIDMVCNSLEYYDFKNKGIDWYIEDGMYKARGTTLGADNGIGCSIILALLANDEILIPNIEAIFTVQEETTMLGAKKLDYSKITGNKIISIDGTEEGVIVVSSAGMTGIKVLKKIDYVDNSKDTYEIKISGLPGGHSGVDIDKNKGNAIKLMAEILKDLQSYELVSIDGGKKDNVIPDECVCIISTNAEINVDKFYKNQPSSLKIEIKKMDKCVKVIKKSDFNQIVDFLHNLPTEVLSYKDGYPQTSLNLAKINTNLDNIEILISIRSSNDIDEEKWINKVRELSGDMTFEINGKIPYFMFKEKSKIRELLSSKYKELYGKDVILEHEHAGLEGGVFSKFIKDLDVCVIAPNLHDIHTPKEYVEIDSVNRVYKWLIEVLKCL